MLTGMNIPSCRETRAHEGLLVSIKANRENPNQPNFMDKISDFT